MSIRILLALTAAIACTIAMVQLFWIGNGIPGATLPAFLIGESIWIGTFVTCLAIARHDRLVKGNPMNAVSSSLLALTLMGMLVIQLAVAFSVLREFGVSISG
ncbi:MAG: hypothetical protein AAGI63_13315 [Planctomycetota bacterium]